MGQKNFKTISPFFKAVSSSGQRRTYEAHWLSGAVLEYRFGIVRIAFARVSSGNVPHFVETITEIRSANR